MYEKRALLLFNWPPLYEASSSPRTIKRLELEIIFHGSNHYNQKASAFIGNGHKQIHKEKWSERVSSQLSISSPA